MQRKIIHVDMDAFYASVEQRDNPELKGKPVIVGGTPQGRGVVAAASYEARKFGVRSAMSAAKAVRLCPQGVFVYPRFSRYREVSDQIEGVFREVTERIEFISLDEAYLDVTENKLGLPLARDVAAYVKKRIREETQLTASAGVGPNKLVAKIASDLRKPDGLVVVPPERVLEFLEKLPVERLWGVGPKTAERMHELGIRKVADLRTCSLGELEREFGKYGPVLRDLSNGIDPRTVESDREPKSRGTETTFDEDILEIGTLLNTLNDQALELEKELREMSRPGRTVTLKVKYSDFKSITRSQTLPLPTDDARVIYEIASELLRDTTDAGRRPVRLIGISMSSFESPDADPDEPYQLWLNLPLK